MLFNSIEFFLFFPVVVLLYYAFKQKWRWLMLLVASYYFYMSWNPAYAILLITSTVIDYWAAIRIHQSEGRKRKYWLWLSLAVNLGLLCSFKYLGFFNESLRTLFGWAGMAYDVPVFDILLPIGISFYTFQTIGYTLDVYRGVKEPERHMGILALYVSFFPQLVAGPIERSTHLIPQLHQHQAFQLKNVVNGLKLMAFGYFKKMVVADRLALLVRDVYNIDASGDSLGPIEHTGVPLIMAAVAFLIQVYYDFSGYTDIALGVALIMGYHLVDNFRRPLFANSIAEFWRRWNISVSSWFRDYVYLPLGGSKVRMWLWALNITVLFLLIGFWHGSKWAYLFYGFTQAACIIFTRTTKGWREWIRVNIGLDKSPKLLNSFHISLTFWVATFCAIAMSGMGMDKTFYAMGHWFTNLSWDSGWLTHGLGLSGVDMIVCGLGIGFCEFIHYFHYKDEEKTFHNIGPMWVRFGIYYIIIFGLIIFGNRFSEEYFYFQF